MSNILALDLSTKFLYQPGINSLHEFDNYCVVYIFLFPNNKKYCGFSSNISHRWQTQTNYSRCPLVWKAMQKYGWNNIKKYIIFKSANKQEALDMEYQTIKNLDLLNPQFGYNLVDGGGALPHNATLNLSEEQIEHKRQIAKQMWENPETAEYMKQRMREEDHVSRMQKTVEERKVIWGTHNLGRTPPNAKTILQIDINTNEVLNEYPSARQAAIALGLDPKSCANIQRTARGKGQTAYGYKWRWKNE